MKRMGFVIAVFFAASLSHCLSAQGNCKVLLPRIGDSYTGECRQGLANGRGEAFGVDQYKGDFKKGLPDGMGTYIWETGERYDGQWAKGMREGKGVYIAKYMGRDSVLVGIWKNDQYVGPEKVPPYTINYRNNVGRVTFMKIGASPNYIRFKFSRSGESSTAPISNLITSGSSGSESLTGNLIGYEHVDFPFEGRIKFTAPNAFNSAMLECELRYSINEPGSWTINIYY